MSDVFADDDLVWEITPVYLKLWITIARHESRSIYRVSTWYLARAPFTYETIPVPLRRMRSNCADELTWVPSFIIVTMFPEG